MTSIKYTLLVGASSLAMVLSAASASAYGGIDDSFNTLKVEDSFNKKTDIDIKKVDDSYNTDIDVKKVDDSYNTVKTDIDVRKDDHSIEDSFNKKTEDSFNKKTEDSFNTVKTDIDVRKDDHSIEDSFNKKDDHSIEDSFNKKDDHSVEDSFNKKTEDSFNTKMEVEDSYNKKVEDSYNKKVEDSYNSMDIENHQVEANNKFFIKGEDVTTSVLAGTVANNSAVIKMGDSGSLGGNTIGDQVQQSADGVNLNLQNTGANANNQQSVAVRANVYNGSMGGYGGGHGGH